VGVDVVTHNVSNLVSQAWQTEGTKVQTITQLPGALVFGVEVRPIGVGQVDGRTTIAGAPRLALVAAVVVAGAAGAALVGDSDRVRAKGVGGRQAPDGVVVTGQAGLLDEFLVDISLVAIEVQGQGLVAGDREDVVQAQVVLLHHVFVVGGVQRSGEVVGELVGATKHVDRLQVTAVAAFGALARFLSEATSVQFQALDFLGGNQGTGEALWQQARIVVLQHWQCRHLVTVLEHGVGDAELDRSTATSQVVWRVGRIGLARLEEVDARTAIVALATVQADGVQAEGIDTHTYGTLGKSGVEGADERLAPFD